MTKVYPGDINLYLASSWKNKERVQDIVDQIRELGGFACYDFTRPAGGTGFAWSQVDPNWESWTNEEYLEALKDPISQAGFASDMNALKAADVCVLLLPAGRSACLELGYCAGAGKRTYVLMETHESPDLMYLMTNGIILDLETLLFSLNELKFLVHTSMGQMIELCGGGPAFKSPTVDTIIKAMMDDHK